MSIRNRITGKLQEALAPEWLEVVDDSAKHVGHLHHPGGVEDRGETHFTVKIVAEAFAGKPRLARHRLVNQTLAEELSGPVHALVIDARAPGEDAR